jgi:ligand-binding sensor domain-containing protein/signal transduction histidine kinase/DNA-binding response OmpR family regulator
MWFGTRNGLNRFDGRSFRTFRSSVADSTSIGSNSILSLFEDRNEQLWVGTYKGIYRYDPVHETFAPFKKVPQGEIRFIKGDGGNNIWIVADLTLYHYDLQTGTVTTHNLKNEYPTALCLSPGGTLWTASNIGTLRKFDARSKAFTPYNIAGAFSKKTREEIQHLYALGDTELLVGTLNTVLHFDTRTTVVKQYLEKTMSGTGFQVREIVQQSADEFWIGTETGIYIMNLQTGGTKTIRKQDDNPYSLTDNVVRALWKDREGGTWIGTFFGGVNYYSKPYNAFRKYFPQSRADNLSGNAVHEICRDKFGAIWIGTEDAGLNKLDPATGRIQHFRPGSERGSLAYHNLHGIIADDNELWVGTYEHGLDVLNLQTGRVIRHYNAGAGPTSFKSNFIVTLYKSRSGNILVGTWNGLFKYNRTQDNFSPIPYFHMQIQSIHEDEDGTLWVGSYGDGVYYYNASRKDSGHLSYQAGNTNSLRNNYVNSLFEDSRNNLWICTETGLYKYDKRTKALEQLATENGLQDNQVFRVQEDDSNTLWISSAKGLVHYNPNTKKSMVYTTVNGLPTNQFNYNSSYKNPDGTLYFGTVKGLVSFMPGTFATNPFVPPVYITGLQVNNSDIVAGSKASPLQQSITYTSQLTLPYDQSNLSFDVAALSYVLPEQNAYAYKMEGLDKEWTSLKEARRIYYTKLPPGSYTFRLKGANESNVWNDAETLLRITITPPIWASTAAYILYNLLAIAFVGLLFRYYHVAMVEKNMRKLKTLEIEKERELYTAKMEFFTNITHEIRTPLTLIKLPLEKLLAQPGPSADVAENLKMMERNTNRLVDLTNQLLDFRKAEGASLTLSFIRTDVNELLKEIAADFEKTARQNEQAFNLEVPRISLQAYIDVEAFRKIVSNLLSNALKYAERHISVAMLPFASNDDVFTIEIKSDGHEIPYELKEKIFEPFYRIKETEKKAGTGIGLSLARSLAELHKGVLDLKPPQHGYNVFSLTLPIHQEKEISMAQEEPVQEQNNAVAAAPTENVVDTGKPLVLLVEDSKEILGFIARELGASYTILKAYNGKEALNVLQNEVVQLVVSDIMMPVMDGLELCKKMKSDFQFSHIPIILLTAKNALQSKIEGLEVGADAYIEKPFSYEHLQAQISNLLQNRKIINDHFARSPLTHLNGISHSKVDSRFLDNLHKAIEDNITNMDLDVDQLSKLMNISRPTLYRKIKAISNLTPNELINLSRLKKAAALLGSGQYKINEVASMIGYSLQSNFSRDFHKQFGITPSTYMNGHHSSNKVE